MRCNLEYKFIGWCQTGTSDKVWGVIPLQSPDPLKIGKYVIFWGRRGKKLQSKIYEDYTWGIVDKIEGKIERGYVKIDTTRLNELYPEFEEDLSKTAMWAMLQSS